MTLTIYDQLEQGSTEWLEARRGIVTASTVGKLLTSTGKVASNDTSRALTETLIAERITGRVEYVHPTRDMQRGTILEPYARDIYAEHWGPVDEVGFMVRDNYGPRIGYSPDGLIGEEGLLEIKSRKPRVQLRTIRDDRVPAENMAQLQAGMLVAGRAWIDYVSYCPGLPLYVKRVTVDPDWQAAIIEAVIKFEEHAVDLIHDYEAEARYYPATQYFDPFDEGEEIY